MRNILGSMRIPRQPHPGRPAHPAHPGLAMAALSLALAACDGASSAPLEEPSATRDAQVDATPTTADAGTADAAGPADAANDAGKGAITLTGSGFGAKTTPRPFFWQDFARTGDAVAMGYAADQLAFGSNAYGSSLAVDPAGGRRAGAGAIKLGMAFNGAGDRDYFPHLAVHTSNQGAGALSATDLYLSFWIRFQRKSGTHQGMVQIKGPRSGSGAAGTNFYTGLFNYVPSIYVSGAGALATIFQETRAVSGAISTGEHFNAPPASAWSTGDWNFVEYRMHLNTPGVADGYFVLFLNGRDTSAGWDATGRASHDQVRVREVGDTQRFNWAFLNPGVDFPGMTASGSYEVAFAEHYVDATFARVVLTDSASYEASTRWALQPCAAWADSSIRIDAPNWGTLATGTTAYFHVFDAAGAHVASLPRTVP